MDDDVEEIELKRLPLRPLDLELSDGYIERREQSRRDIADGKGVSPEDVDKAHKLRKLSERIAAAASDEPEQRPTVWFGHHGPDVAYLQHVLDRRGLYSLDYGDEDGHFGVATDAAVRAFQSLEGLKATAIVGPETWTALQE